MHQNSIDYFALLRILPSLLFGTISSVGYAQSIVIDGSTDTNVSIDANGATKVEIAPVSGNATSLNRYETFNVELPGVSLNNSVVNADTIVNEVTSGNPSKIEGNLSVLGKQADVIIANPNGITINGGKFTNTGNVGIISGAVSFDQNQLVKSQIRQGQIKIGAKGLSGVIEELDLIAKSINIEGDINANSPNDIKTLNIITGNNDVTFDPNRILPELFPWADIDNGGGINSGFISVDITNQSSIAAGAINISVTEEGAGVRIAGNVAASERDFRLTSDGKLELLGANIISKRGLDIKVGEADLASNENQTYLKSEDTGIILETTKGDIDLADSRVEGQQISSSNLSSVGGVTLISKGKIIQSNKDSDFDAEIISNLDGILLSADSNIELYGNKIASNKDLDIKSSQAIILQQVSGVIKDSVHVLSSGKFEVRSSELNAEDDITITASEAYFGLDDSINNGSQTKLIASSGGVFIETIEGGVINEGSLISGKLKVKGEVQADAAVAIVSKQDVINKSISEEKLAILFGEDEGLSIKTEGAVINDNGRIFSNAELRIDAAHNFTNKTQLTSDTPQELLISHNKSDNFLQKLWMKGRRETKISGNYGNLKIDNELAWVLAVDDVHINAQNINNIGGEITGADIALTSGGKVENIALLTGAVKFSQKCRFFCRSSGYSNIDTAGGTISSSNDLNVTAADTITSVAGSFVGLNNVTFVAPTITAKSLNSFIYLERPTGLSGFFRGARGWIANEQRGAQFAALNGDLVFDGSVTFDGVSLSSSSSPIFTGLNDIVATSDDPSLVGYQDLGILWSLF